MKLQPPIIYNTSKKEIFEKLDKIRLLVFDIDKTLIDYQYKYSDLKEGVTWRVCEKAIGLDKNPEYMGLLYQYFELARFPEKDQERKEISKKINSFWKGHAQEELINYLLPIPYLPYVKEFFEHIRDSKRDFSLAILSSAPAFFLEHIVQELDTNFDYLEGCECVIDSQGIFTGEIRSTGLYGKKESFENLCKKNQISLEETIYHGDHYLYDGPVIKLAGIGIAVRPFDGPHGKLAQIADIILYDWAEHPLLKIL